VSVTCGRGWCAERAQSKGLKLTASRGHVTTDAQNRLKLDCLHTFRSLYHVAESKCLRNCIGKTWRKQITWEMLMEGLS
jgi:hypothetical protein